MQSEIYAMQYIKKHTTIPLPMVYGSNLDVGNPVGTEYVFLELLPGRELTTFLSTVPNEVKAKVYV
jgi:hypothetical protein